MARRVWLAALVLGTLAAAPAQAQVKMEWKLKEGDSFYVETVNKMKMSMEFMGKNIDQNMTQTILMKLTVKKKTPDSVTLETKYESVKSKQEGGFMPGGMNMDEKMEGAAFTFTMDNAGKVTKFEGYEDFIKRLIGDNEEFGKMMRAMMSEDTFKQQVAGEFTKLPEKPVNMGDTWTHTQKVPLGPMGTFEVTSKYAYQGQERDGHLVTGTVDMKFSPPKGDGGAFPLKITKANFKDEGSKTRFIFDPQAGRVSRSEAQMRINGSMTMDVNGMEITMNMRMDQNTTSRTLDRRP
jgi:hypothetical protein